MIYKRFNVNLKGEEKSIHWLRPQTWYLLQISQIIFVEEKSVMWRNLKFLYITDVKISQISPHMEKFQMSPHDRSGKIWNSPHLACVWCRKRRHICKIYDIFLKKISFVKIYALCREIHFVAIYALLCGLFLEIQEFFEITVSKARSLEIFRDIQIF